MLLAWVGGARAAVPGKGAGVKNSSSMLSSGPAACAGSAGVKKSRGGGEGCEGEGAFW